MFRELFELFSMCDWITPLVESGKDFNNFATGTHGTLDISVDKGELHYAKKVIEKSGYRVISTTTVAFDPEALITVECYGGIDGYDSIRWIMDALSRAGIDHWVSPGWA